MLSKTFALDFASNSSNTLLIAISRIDSRYRLHI
jgi:hypothetical protein